MTNSRKHNRRKTSDYFVAEDAKTGEVIGRVLDMSTDGLRLMTMEPFGKSRRLKGVIKLQKAVDGSHEITFEAECRWCLENERAGWFEAGFKFCDLSPEVLATIKHLLKDWVASDSNQRNHTDSSKEKEPAKSPLESVRSVFRDSDPVTPGRRGSGSRN